MSCMKAEKRSQRINMKKFSTKSFFLVFTFLFSFSIQLYAQKDNGNWGLIFFDLHIGRQVREIAYDLIEGAIDSFYESKEHKEWRKQRSIERKIKSKLEIIKYDLKNGNDYKKIKEGQERNKKISNYLAEQQSTIRQLFKE